MRNIIFVISKFKIFVFDFQGLSNQCIQMVISQKWIFYKLA